MTFVELFMLFFCWFYMVGKLNRIAVALEKLNEESPE